MASPVELAFSIGNGCLDSSPLPEFDAVEAGPFLGLIPSWEAQSKLYRGLVGGIRAGSGVSTNFHLGDPQRLCLF